MFVCVYIYIYMYMLIGMEGITSGCQDHYEVTLLFEGLDSVMGTTQPRHTECSDCAIRFHRQEKNGMSCLEIPVNGGMIIAGGL